jgi:hypothetical protein
MKLRPYCAKYARPGRLDADRVRQADAGEGGNAPLRETPPRLLRPRLARHQKTIDREDDAVGLQHVIDADMTASRDRLCCSTGEADTYTYSMTAQMAISVVVMSRLAA